MGIPLVGKEHQRKASTSQVADRKLRAVRIRISGASGSGCSSAKHQQSFQSQEPSADNSEHFVGTLLSGRAASKGDVHARRIQRLCKELDSPKMGQRTAGRAEDRRGGTLAARSGRDGWDQSQDQMCDVGFVFTRRSLGILRSQFRSEVGEERSKLQRTSGFHLPSLCRKGKKPLDLAAVLKKKIQPAFKVWTVELETQWSAKNRKAIRRRPQIQPVRGHSPNMQRFGRA